MYVSPIRRGYVRGNIDCKMHYTNIVNVLKYQILFSFCSQIKCWLSGPESQNACQTRPLIHLLNRIKSILCYEEAGPVSYE